MHFLSLPTEILEFITIALDYASEVNSLSQTCQRLYGVANHRLYVDFAECSPRGLDRVVQNDNADALYRLLVNGVSFDQYFRTTGHPTPLRLTVEKDLSNVAKLLVVYLEVLLGNGKSEYRFLPGNPSYREYEDDLEWTLHLTAAKGSLGVLKAIASSLVVKWWQNASALAYAVRWGQLASARYLIEEAGVNVNTKVIVHGFFDSVLAESAYQGDLEMAKLLVEAGADLKRPEFDNIMKSPLYIAAARNHDTVVQYLTEKGMCFSPVQPYDIHDLEEYASLPNYTISRIVGGDAIRALMASPSYNWQARGSLLSVAAACGDKSLYEEILSRRDPYHNQQHLVTDFGVAVFHRHTNFSWSKLISYTTRYENVSAFDILLDYGPPENQAEASKGWLKKLLSEAVDYPEHTKILSEHGYLDTIKDIKILKDLFTCAFASDDFSFVWRLLETSGFRPLDTFYGLDFEFQEMSVLRIAAYYAPVGIFKELLAADNLTLDPSDAMHRSAMVSAALGTNFDVLDFFLEKGFEVNSLYEMDAPNRDRPAEALIIQVASVYPGPDRFITKEIREGITTTIEYLLDNGAGIDTENSEGRTALSIALEVGNFELARILCSRGADPLVGLQSQSNASGLERLIQLFERSEYDLRFLDMFQAFLELMAARGYQSDDFLRLMPNNEGTLARPRLTSQLANSPAVKGPIDLPYFEDKIYVRWSHFFLIKELRKQYWRSVYPIRQLFGRSENRRLQIS
ncbi:ankyrin [Penicillium samsonianum]|uniref:ankyrin n=1 Tax=Penicillium samsonianum TaxID=1882272 RepID=UPI0025493AD4|nr:ankyrin [Penicillium samsonianum]KAJ6126137.1 ankyrin [Penicillium samsonianum]